MFTADKARSMSGRNLDEIIEKEVTEAVGWGLNETSIRVYNDDWFKDTIKEELEKRGFTCYYVPDICICGDVSFSW